MIVLQTPRLILRPFSAGDLDEMATLMANADFMRFSLGVFSREQTAAFLKKIRTRDRDRSRPLGSRPGYRSSARRPRPWIQRVETAPPHFAHPSGQCGLTPRRGEKWNDAGKGNDLSRFFDDRLQHQPAITSGDKEIWWRWMNSFASAR